VKKVLILKLRCQLLQRLTNRKVAVISKLILCYSAKDLIETLKNTELKSMKISGKENQYEEKKIQDIYHDW
jgi:hypothetical protein